MKIPKTLKHKPVIVTEDYENIDGRKAYNTDAKGLSLGLAQWNDRGNLIFPPKSGGTPVKSGPANPKSFLCTVFLTWRSLPAGATFIFKTHTVIRNYMTLTTL